VISHIVLFNAKPNLSRADVQVFAQQLRATMVAAASVRRATVGRRIPISSDDRRDFGDATYEFAAIVEFDDKNGLTEYLKHPMHQDLGRLFWLHCASTVVLEVEAVDAKSPEVIPLLVNNQN